MAVIEAPPEQVLDLFAVPGAVERIPGGQGSSVRAGDLVLSPDRDPRIQTWLSPILARLAVRLDEAPSRRRRDLRVAMPVPARDGSWVVDGWAASRYEPGTVACRDVEVALAAGRVLHAQLASALPQRPPGLAERTDRWARAETLAFGPARPMLEAAEGLPAAHVVGRVERHLDDRTLGRAQLVHADLAGNVLLDDHGAPVVIDVAPAWRPVLWAEALCVVDAVAWYAAPRAALAPYRSGLERQAALRALAFRALSDRGLDPAAYDPVLDVVAPDRPSTGSR